MKEQLVDEEGAAEYSDSEPLSGSRDHHESDFASTCRKVVVATYLILVVLCLVAMYHYGWKNFAAAVFECSNSGNVALRAVILVPLLIVSTVLWIPVPAFYMILLGYFCGFWLGAVLVFVSEIVSLGICIWLVRAFGFDPLSSVSNRGLDQFRHLAGMAQDLKLLALLRFMIFIPVTIRNYVAAMGNIKVSPVLAVSLPGALYFSSLMAYMGSACHKVVGKVQEGNTSIMTDIFDGYQLLAILSVSVVVMFFCCYVSCSSDYQKAEEEEDEEDEEEQTE